MSKRCWKVLADIPLGKAFSQFSGLQCKCPQEREHVVLNSYSTIKNWHEIFFQIVDLMSVKNSGTSMLDAWEEKSDRTERIKKDTRKGYNRSTKDKLMNCLHLTHFILFFFICSEFCHTLKWNSHGNQIWKRHVHPSVHRSTVYHLTHFNNYFQHWSTLKKINVLWLCFVLEFSWNLKHMDRSTASRKYSTLS